VRAVLTHPCCRPAPLDEPCLSVRRRACLATTGSFPFQFDPVFAIFGALALRFVEWLLVMRCKTRAKVNGANLKELSIYRSQQLNLATVPVKVRRAPLASVPPDSLPTPALRVPTARPSMRVPTGKDRPSIIARVCSPVPLLIRLPRA
jgi:hypothetical protein